MLAVHWNSIEKVIMGPNMRKPRRMTPVARSLVVKREVE